jgi:glycogen debranching enzyme
VGRRPGPAAAATSQIIAAAQARARIAAGRCRPGDDTDRLLAVAADQLLIGGREGPAVVAGYPWFGEWSRDTMTSYEGLVLETGRAGEGRLLLQRAAASLSEGCWQTPPTPGWRSSTPPMPRCGSCTPSIGTWR